MSKPAADPQRAKRRNLRVDTFVAAPEKHISVEAYELKLAIKNRLELEDRAVFDDLCKLMEGVANFDFIDLKDRMRNNFLPFACGAKNSTYLQRSSKNLPTTPVLDKQEDEFVADVYEVLRASHYTLLTKEEWDLATSENFNLNLPMTVNWEYMDHDLLTKFWSSSTERKAIRRNLPDCMADRILVFHRGMGLEKLSGLLIDQKLDLLMDYTVFYLLDKIKKPIMNLINKYLKKKKKPEEELAEVAAAAAQEAANRALDGVPLDSAAVGQYQFEGTTMIASKHKFARAVERKTLARQCPTLLTLLKAFPKTMELQEPTFKDIVVVYRRSLPPRQPPTAAANAPNKSKDERMQGILAYRNINIKVFGETPMADVEMIFPEKKVGIKPFQLVNLMVTLFTALVTGALVLWKAGSDINMNIVWTAASLVLTRCFTVYNTAQTQRTMLQQRMTSALYDKMQDSQEGVVSVIMEEMADQQLKQMLLAYMLLIIKDRALLQDDLDNSCEDFLYKEFNHPIDYDVAAALPRLKRWGLVRTNQQGKLEALSMPAAISYLEAAWSTAYKVIGSEAASAKTLDMISGNFSVFGAGIDKYMREREQAAAAAEAEAKRGFFGGKTAAGISSVGSGLTQGVSAGFGTVGSGLTNVASAGFGKAKGILPFGTGGKSTGNLAAAGGSTGGAAAGTAAMTELAQNGSTGAPDGSAVLAPAGSSKAGSSTADVLPSSPEPSSELHSGQSLHSEGSYGGANPEKKKSSFKNIFKHRKPTAAPGVHS